MGWNVQNKFVQKWKEKWAEFSEIQLGANIENIEKEDTVIKKTLRKGWYPYPEWAYMPDFNLSSVLPNRGVEKTNYFFAYVWVCVCAQVWW